MSKQQGNELPDVEVLGEWDHGMLDPVLSAKDQKDAELKEMQRIQDIKKAVVKVEGQVEGAVRNTLHKVEHALEDMVHHGAEGQTYSDELAGVDMGVALAATFENSS